MSILPDIDKRIDDIYDKALVVCANKCKKSVISHFIDWYILCKEEPKHNQNKSAWDELKERVRDYKREGYDCYECRCVPDKDYIRDSIKALIEEANDIGYEEGKKEMFDVMKGSCENETKPYGIDFHQICGLTQRYCNYYNCLIPNVRKLK